MILLTTGVTTAMVQNTVYALPAITVFLRATDVLETSLDGNTFSRVTATTTGLEIADMCVRCTTVTTCVVIIKRIG